MKNDFLKTFCEMKFGTRLEKHRYQSGTRLEKRLKRHARNMMWDGAEQSRDTSICLPSRVQDVFMGQGSGFEVQGVG